MFKEPGCPHVAIIVCGFRKQLRCKGQCGEGQCAHVASLILHLLVCHFQGAMDLYLKVDIFLSVSPSLLSLVDISLTNNVSSLYFKRL